MKTFQYLSLVTVAALVFMPACDARKPDSATTGGAASDTGSHVHDDGTVHKNSAGDSGGHTHGEGPHGGTIADWGGGKFHVEFTVDHDEQQATVFILGGDAKTAASIDADEVTLVILDPAFTVALKASPLDDDPEGKASRYVGNHENLGIVREYEGSMSGVVAGTVYSGSFREVAHDH